VATSYTNVVSTTLALPNAGAYGTADSIGGKNTLTDAERNGAAATGIIHSVVVKDKAEQSAALIVIFFNADPSASTLTDNSAVSVHDDDAGKVIGVVSITAADYEDIGACHVATIRNLGLPFELSAGSLYFAVRADGGTPTYANGDLIVDLGILPD
jgi:hypothetical protein